MIRKIWPVFSALENLLPYMYGIILSSVCCYKKLYLGLLWWSSGWESACRCRGHRFSPWFRKIPLAAEQLSPCTTTTEARMTQSPRSATRGHHNEKPACHNQRKPTHSNKDPVHPKLRNFLKYLNSDM